METRRVFALETWEQLAQLLRGTQTEITQKNVTEILGQNYLLPSYLKNNWSQARQMQRREEEEEEESSGPTLSRHQLSLARNVRNSMVEYDMEYTDASDTSTQTKSSANMTHLASAFHWIGNKTTYFLNEIDQGRTCPENLEPDFEEAEYVCTVIAYTLLRDRWYEYGKCTCPRNPHVKYVYILWGFMLAIRLYRRLRTAEKNIVFKGEKFGNHVTIPDYSNDVAVLKFEPWRLYQAMLLLDSCYMRDIVIYDEVPMSACFAYRELLLDRCAMVAHLKLRGTSEQLVQSHVVWIHKCERDVALNTATVLPPDTETETKLQYMDPDVQRKLDEEKGKREKARSENTVYDKEKEQKAAEARTVRSIHDHVRDYTAQQLQLEMNNMKEMLAKLHKVREHYAALKKKGTENESFSMISAAKKNEEHIKKVEALISELELSTHARLTHERTEKLEKIRRDTLNSLLRNTGDKKKSTLHDDMYDAMVPWFIDNAPLALSLCRWHHLNLAIDILHTPLEFELANELKLRALHNVEFMEPVTLAQNMRNWFVSLDLPCCRREIYRQRVNYKPSFNEVGAWTQIQRESDSAMDKFPSTMEEFLNTNGPYHHSAMAYIGYNYISQMFPTLDIDTSFFYWDLDDEFLSLDRRAPTHVAMCKIGSSWCLYVPKKGEAEAHQSAFVDPETGLLRVKAIGRDFFVCLAQYCLKLEEGDWKVYQRRGGGREVDIKNSALFTTTRKYITKYTTTQQQENVRGAQSLPRERPERSALPVGSDDFIV